MVRSPENAFTGMEHMILSWYDAGCTNASVPPFVEIRLAQCDQRPARSKCVEMKQIVRHPVRHSSRFG